MEKRNGIMTHELVIKSERGAGRIDGPSHDYALDMHLQEALKSFQQKALQEEVVWDWREDELKHKHQIENG
jgi:hypothetical protein